MNNKYVRIALLLGAIFLPRKVKPAFYNNIFGWNVDPSVRIGISYIDVVQADLAENVRIGHFNTIRNLELFKIGKGSKFGSFNKVNAIPVGSGVHFSDEKDRKQSLEIGENTGITNHHYFDCNNRVVIGDFCILAGHRISVFTHSINIEHNRQETAPIEIGSYCMVGACCVLTRGAGLPSFSILGANSTLHKKYSEQYSMYSGVPAVLVKNLDKESAYFKKTEAFVP